MIISRPSTSTSPSHCRVRGADGDGCLCRRAGASARKPFAEHRIVLQLSDNDAAKQSLVISVANNLLKHYDPDKVAIEVVAFGPGIDLLRPGNVNRARVESLVAQGARFDICLNTVDTIERESGKRPEFIAVATPVQVGVGHILSLTENGFTLVRP